MSGFFRHLSCDERGATSIEYGLIAAGIAMAILGAVTLVADESNGLLNNAMATVSATLSGGGEQTSDPG